MLLRPVTEHKRILVVDDDPSIRGLLKAVLTRAGYEVDLASEGAEALVALGTATYRAVILDLMMPGVSGFEVIKELEKESSPHPRCLIVVSATSERNLEELKSSAVHSKIRKPFDLEKLLAQISDCVGAQK
jgi:two-component system OmpR family response regulator